MTILKTYGKITAALFLLAASINLFLARIMWQLAVSAESVFY